MKILQKYFYLSFIYFFFLSNANASLITYKEILDNPIDLELNLNYAKQQEKAGNVKSTIATLERLSTLYPKNVDIKLYLLSILLKMDSKVKVDFMVRTMLNDPNTTEDTKKLIVELLSENKLEAEEEEKQKKWIAYLDFNYSQTEENNISGRTKSDFLLKKDKAIPFTANDSKNILTYDKTFVQGSALTLGRILDESSSLFMNLGANINTQNKKFKGESDVYSNSLSYFKAYKNHIFSPYIYYNKLNYRMQEDYQSRGIGINNTHIFNNKFNLNYALSYSDTRYHSKARPIDIQGSQTFKHAGDLNNNQAINSSIRLNYNLSNKSQISTRFIYNDIEAFKNYNSFESGGANLTFTRILPIGTFSASATHTTNVYDAKNVSISEVNDRKDRSLLTNLSLSGNINQIIPFLGRVNKDNNIFYTLSKRDSNINSNLINNEIQRSFTTFKITKRLNLND